MPHPSPGEECRSSGDTQERKGCIDFCEFLLGFVPQPWVVLEPVGMPDLHQIKIRLANLTPLRARFESEHREGGRLVGFHAAERHQI